MLTALDWHCTDSLQFTSLSVRIALRWQLDFLIIQIHLVPLLKWSDVISTSILKRFQKNQCPCPRNTVIWMEHNFLLLSLFIAFRIEWHNVCNFSLYSGGWRSSGNTHLSEKYCIWDYLCIFFSFSIFLFSFFYFSHFVVRHNPLCPIILLYKKVEWKLQIDNKNRKNYHVHLWSVICMETKIFCLKYDSVKIDIPIFDMCPS